MTNLLDINYLNENCAVAEPLVKVACDTIDCPTDCSLVTNESKNNSIDQRENITHKIINPQSINKFIYKFCGVCGFFGFTCVFFSFLIVIALFATGITLTITVSSKFAVMAPVSAVVGGLFIFCICFSTCFCANVTNIYFQEYERGLYERGQDNSGDNSCLNV